MARLLRDNLIDIALDIDPRDENGVVVSSAVIASYQGDKFSIGQILSFYNQARIALVNAMVKMEGTSGAYQQGALIKNAAGSLTLSGGQISIPRPADIIHLLGIAILPDNVEAVVLPPELQIVVIGGKNSHYIESLTAKNVFFFPVGNNFINADVALNGKLYGMTYIGLVFWVVGDVNASTVETIDDSLWPILKELAVRLSTRAGAAEIDALALSLLGGRR